MRSQKDLEHIYELTTNWKKTHVDRNRAIQYKAFAKQYAIKDIITLDQLKKALAVVKRAQKIVNR